MATLDSLPMRDRNREKQRWVSFLMADLGSGGPPPARSRVLVGGGLLLLLTDADGVDLVVEVVHREAGLPGRHTAGDTVVRTHGDARTPDQDRWLAALWAAVQRLVAEPRARARFEGYLRWATHQPKRSFPSQRPADRAQGGELLVRLLEPCQARCSFCICRSAQADLVASLDVVDEILVDGIAAGHPRVVFTGGEPTLVKQLPELVGRARALGFGSVGLQTNGIKLADRAYLDHLVDQGLDTVLQSLHSHDPATHEGIFQIPGCWEACVQGARNVMESGQGLTLNFVTTRANLDHHADFVSFVADTFAVPLADLAGTAPHLEPTHRRGAWWTGPARAVRDSGLLPQRASRRLDGFIEAHMGGDPVPPVRTPTITFSAMSPQGWGLQNLQELPRLSDVARSVRAALERADHCGVQVAIPGLCGFPACFLPEQAHRFHELRDAAPLDLETRTKLPVCADCAFEPCCTGTWQAYLDHHGADEFRPARAEDGYKLPAPAP